MGRIIVSNAPTASSNVGVGTANLEQERYFSAIVAATPKSVPRLGSSWGSAESMLSIPSLVSAAGTPGLSVSNQDTTLTPDSGRKPNHLGQNFSKAMQNIRTSGKDAISRSTATLGRWQNRKNSGGSPTPPLRNLSR